MEKLESTKNKDEIQKQSHAMITPNSEKVEFRATKTKIISKCIFFFQFRMRPKTLHPPEETHKSERSPLPLHFSLESPSLIFSNLPLWRTDFSISSSYIPSTWHIDLKWKPFALMEQKAFCSFFQSPRVLEKSSPKVRLEIVRGKD